MHLQSLNEAQVLANLLDSAKGHQSLQFVRCAESKLSGVLTAVGLQYVATSSLRVSSHRLPKEIFRSRYAIAADLSISTRWLSRVTFSTVVSETIFSCDRDFLDLPTRDAVPSSYEFQALIVRSVDNHEAVIFESFVQSNIPNCLGCRLESCEEECLFSLSKSSVAKPSRCFHANR